MNDSAHRYPIVVVSLSDEDGGGFLAYVPDLYGCVSDGDTPEEAAKNVRDAILEWCDEAERRNRPIPEPGSAARTREKERRELIKLIKKQDKILKQQDDALSLVQSAVERLADTVSALLKSEAAYPRHWEAAVWSQSTERLSRRSRESENTH